ncbi:MAG: TolC family protein [Bacteroidales bacterium]|jgi:outer membrane protein|nr:TolC family protein [Bacteroidales bacterium]
MQKLYIALLLLSALTLGAQENTNVSNTFSLEQAIAYGLENNYDLKNAQTDVEIAKKVVKETTAIGLPQVNASLSNTNYIDIPTTLMPDFISPSVYGVNQDNFGLIPLVPLADEMGTFPVKFGTKYNANAELSVSQIVFSGEYLIGLRAAKTYKEQTAQMLVKTEQSLREHISKSYFLVLSLREQKQILEKTLTANEKLLAETKQMYENGFVEDTEVSQLEILVNNLNINIENLKNESETALNYLKMNMGMGLENDLNLTDNLNDLLESSLLIESKNFDLEQNIDFQMMQTQLSIADLQIKREQSTYLPQLSAFFNAQSNAMRSEFNFFDSKETWFPTTVWGFNLNVPIWSSGSRSSKVQQAKLSRTKLDESAKQLNATLNLEVQTVENNFQLHTKEYQNSLNNIALSEKIYQKTQAKFKAGLATSFDLIQAHNNFLNASGSYTTAIFNVLNDRVALNRLYSRSKESSKK